MTLPNISARRWMLAAIAVLGGGFAAEAAEHPPFAPTRDVAVSYQVQASRIPSGKMGGGDAQGEHSIQMRYSAASGRLRIEPDSMPGYMLIDRAGGRITIVMEPMHSFMDMPFDNKAGAGLLLNDTMHFVRGGTDRVAGMVCNLWTVTHDKTTARLCITEDGVILRGEGSDPKRGEGTLLATAVTYAAQPAAKFSPPADFHRMEMPAGIGGKPAKTPG